MEMDQALERMFTDTFVDIVQDLTTIPEHHDIEDSCQWLAQVLRYNVPHGKKARGMAVAKAYVQFSSDDRKDLKRACILGWCVEILQASFLVADDIMDKSEMRRGRPCWYKVNNLGNGALNDVFLLENSLYFVVKKYFHQESYYVDLLDLFRAVTFRTTLGQSLDTRTSPAICRDLSVMTIERYQAIVKYKTSYYSFCLPVFLAFTMCGVDDKIFLEQAEHILLKMGYIFQAQDDILDCFGDPFHTGKIGRDIADGKCTWPLVKALSKASTEQKRILIDSYGLDEEDKIETVKKLYEELHVLKDFHIFEEKCYDQITKLIDNLPSTNQFKFFSAFLLAIYRRQK